MTIVINIDSFYSETDTARLSDISAYINKGQDLAGEGNEVVLTGPAPVWLYLKIAHALHGKARRLIYRSPVTGDVIVFDHSPS